MISDKNAEWNKRALDISQKMRDLAFKDEAIRKANKMRRQSELLKLRLALYIILLLGYTVVMHKVLNGYRNIQYGSPMACVYWMSLLQMGTAPNIALDVHSLGGLQGNYKVYCQKSLGLVLPDIKIHPSFLNIVRIEYSFGEKGFLYETS